MKATAHIFGFILTFIGVSASLKSLGCSMCKVTINGRTYLGNNEDSWRRGSRIWFEQGKVGKLGCLYVGYNELPQGGMNEAGLAFDGLTTLPKPVKNSLRKKEISNPIDFLKDIMQRCKTVEDVKRFAIQYNRQKFFNNGECLFTDKAGNYLVMEADTLISGNDDKYLIANFCPSITPEEEKLNWNRYKRGALYLNNHATDTNSNLCFALTDTMHECRERIGDGTMYSFVADLDRGDFTLCFYHDFQHPITFNLQQELAKGDHLFEMASLFPNNAEYSRFLSYKTPRNNTAMLSFLFLSGGLFAFSSLYFAVNFLRNRVKVLNQNSGKKAKLMLAATSLILLYYVTVLYKQEAVYYSPAPYKDFQFSVLNIAAYIPFLLLALIVPMIKMNVQAFQFSSWGIFQKSLFTLNNLCYLLFIALFFYWGLYSVF